MSSEFHRVEAAFHSVLERIEFEPSPIALQAVCGADVELRAQVESLLGSHEASQSFLDRPVFEYVKDELSTLKHAAMETKEADKQFSNDPTWRHTGLGSECQTELATG